MSPLRFTQEFKKEAVRQVIDRKYLIAEVSVRLGISAHSLYKWVEAASPDNTEKQNRDLREAKDELLRLRAKLRRTEEELDILKRPARNFARKPNKALLRQQSQVRTSDRYDASDAVRNP